MAEIRMTAVRHDLRLRMFLVILFSVVLHGCASQRATTPSVLQFAQTIHGQPLPPHRETWNAYRRPSESNTTGLYLLQPYKPGRIPLILIHGLASDAYTWETIILALRSDPDIRDRFQVWVFQYPTGNSYLKAAADLRHELLTIRADLDPTGSDAAFDQTILVGHSMGGIVAKLQIADSGSTLWDAVSDVPLDAMSMDDKSRAEISAALLFEHVPFVRQVVFIATPHRGSRWTENVVGKIARNLVEFPEAMQQQYESLMTQNRSLFKNPMNRSARCVCQFALARRIAIAGHRPGPG